MYTKIRLNHVNVNKYETAYIPKWLCFGDEDIVSI